MAVIDRAFIVLSGIPGTGKSTYAGWLHETYDFVHRDVDYQGLPPDLVVRDQRPVIVDWGFPANEPCLTTCITLIRNWKTIGAKLWWFDGDREAALASFLKRGTVPKQQWDYQMKGINDNWSKIEAEIDGRIDTVSTTARLTVEEVFSYMFT